MIKTKRQPGIILNSDLPPSKRDRMETGADSDSESEADLLERLFGRREEIEKQPTLIADPVQIDSEPETDQTDVEPTISKPECVWEDEADNTSQQEIARQKFSDLSGGWMNIKPVATEEDQFGGAIFKQNNRVLPEKEIDFEECGVIGIRGGGAVSAFQFHPNAPAAMVTQADTLTMFQVEPIPFLPLPH